MGNPENDEQQQSGDSSKVGPAESLDTSAQAVQKGSPKTPTVTVSNTDAQKLEEKVDLDTLYPVFWGLQTFFSAPTRLFHTEHFCSFRDGLGATLSAFKKANTDLDTRMTAKTVDETRRNLKRKRDGEDVEISNTFNPKYLTSRELFDLEVGMALGKTLIDVANRMTNEPVVQ
jgi:THO complex subunit 1